jgi:hypothetical protein
LNHISKSHRSSNSYCSDGVSIVPDYLGLHSE